MVKIKEKEKKDKYLDLAKEVRKLWNMRMMAISIVIGMFGIIHKGLEKGLEELEIKVKIKSIQTKVLLKRDWILRSILAS